MCNVCYISVWGVANPGMKITITLNGEKRPFDIPANRLLLSLLRNEAGCSSVKHGCETGECGACCVLLDGRIVNSCILLAAQADQREIVTLEGLGRRVPELESIKAASSEEIAKRTSFQNPEAFSGSITDADYDALHPIQQAFVDTHAIQCGYCTPGMILSTLALFAEKGLMELPYSNQRRKVRKNRPSPPSEAEIRDALAGNLCRCTGYVKPVEAVKQAAEKLAR